MTTAALWAKNRPLARKIAAGFSFPGADKDDVVQEAMIGLWKAARSFDEGRGPFTAHARIVIEKHLFDCVKASTRRKQEMLTLSTRIVVNDGQEAEILSTLPHLHQVFDRAEESEDVRRLLRAIRDDLTPFQRHCVLGVASGLSYHEIGSVKRVDTELYRARRKLREILCP